MKKTPARILILAAAAAMLIGCTSKETAIPINKGSVAPGTAVSQKGVERKLLGTPIKMGEKLTSVMLEDALGGGEVDISQMTGKVTILSIVPSLTTKVCEQQTHYLGEEGDALPASVARITISRDTPEVQKKFAGEAELTDLTYLSDSRAGDFGRATGLLMDGADVLARSVLVLDKDGVVQYIQVVPEVANLPDMEAAFAKARALDAE